MPDFPNLPNFDPSAPLPSFEPNYDLLNKIQQDIADEKREQERKATIIAISTIIIGIISLFLAYFTLNATVQANSANQAVKDATDKLLQTEESIRQLQEQFLSYQTKNDSLNAIVLNMRKVLKNHKITD